ncbi:MAG: hypothetical protein ACFB0C_19705 [Leptolyngbyaceae cyanobacterium]
MLLDKTNPVQVPEWAALPNATQGDGLIYEGAPLRYRFDGSEGGFFVGQHPIGADLAMQVLTVEWRQGERFGRPNQSWMDVAFVDDHNRVATISLKKDSAVNLHFFLTQELRESGNSAINPMAVRVLLRATDMESYDGDYNYYTLTTGEWSFVSEARFKTAKKFWNSKQFQWLIPGETE